MRVFGRWVALRNDRYDHIGFCKTPLAKNDRGPDADLRLRPSGHNGISWRFSFFCRSTYSTGTTVQLGHSLIVHGWSDVLAACIIVGAFVAGSILGRILIEIGARNRIRRIASVTLLIEALILFVTIRLRTSDRAATYRELALLAGAIGIRTATLTGIGPLTVHTTFVTGMLNKIGQLVSHILFRSFDLRKSGVFNGGLEKHQRQDIAMALFLGIVWSCYVTGAAFGTWSFDLWRIKALFIAILLLVFSAVADNFWPPLCTRREQEQSER